MKIKALAVLPVLAVLATSCATPPPPAPTLYQANDPAAFVIDSLDATSFQVIQPVLSQKQANEALLAECTKNPSHKTAVVILENYNEPQPGDQFRDRSTSLFVVLRQAGYQHIIFLQGNGTANPVGLVTVASYD